ncbi:phosphatidylinositol kinase (PIK-L1), partial [Thraustotheca clavata]
MNNNDEEIVKCHLKWAEWQLAIHEQQLDRVPIGPVLNALKTSTELEPSSYKAWHAWALMNFHVAEYYSQLPPGNNQIKRETYNIGPYIASAIEGFFRSIALGRSRWAANVQQDILRVLTLWFAYGHRSDVHGALVAGFQSVSIETWLIVIPQLIARIHSPHPRIQSQLHRLLTSIGTQHPHALIYPLSVALKSPLEVRQRAAEDIMNAMRKNYVDLVDEALLVSRELIRVAILWHEMWHEGLEEASRLYFGEHDVQGMMAVLEPLHAMMEKGPETLREVSFHQAFGRDLKEAYDWIQRYMNPNGGQNESDLNRAWDLYYHVFRRINKQLPQLTTLELQYVSPNLLQANNLQLAVPGTYRAGHAIVKIRSFIPTMLVMTSKQRPRRITMVGTNGLEYMFLLKGHEDLRQDERVTQLFGLVNALLINDRTTSKKDLKITRYPVIPLSHNAGIVGWVPNCDTLHQLIRDFREARKILLNIEHRLMLQMAPDYDVLCLLQKVEVFQFALENTAGQDLYKVLWLKSENSEVWLDRRTNYTRSLAAMSMVGYILGLGDRHPSNLMLHRFTGTIVHIDFGDCFEVAMQ